MILFFIPQANKIQCQTIEAMSGDTIEIVETFEIYALEVEIENIIVIGKERCTKGKWALYEINIQNVFSRRDTTIYDINFTGLCYMLVNNKIKLTKGKSYYVTAFNSYFKDYININRVFEGEVFFKVLPGMHQEGLFECLKLSLYQKIKLWFGGIRSEIYEKTRKKNKEKNIFWQAIQKRKKNPCTH